MYKTNTLININTKHPVLHTANIRSPHLHTFKMSQIAKREKKTLRTMPDDTITFPKKILSQHIYKL